jgi:hypothetical protein
VTNWLRRLQRGEDITVRASGSGPVADLEIEFLFPKEFDEFPFHSVRSLSAVLARPRTTVWRHLHSAGYVPRNLQLVPHALSPSQKVERVQQSIELKSVLESAKRRGWRYFLTGDESWFYLRTDHDPMWIQDGEEVPTRDSL